MILDKLPQRNDFLKNAFEIWFAPGNVWKEISKKQDELWEHPEEVLKIGEEMLEKYNSIIKMTDNCSKSGNRSVYQREFMEGGFYGKITEGIS